MVAGADPDAVGGSASPEPFFCFRGVPGIATTLYPCFVALGFPLVFLWRFIIRRGLVSRVQRSLSSSRTRVSQRYDTLTVTAERNWKLSAHHFPTYCFGLRAV